MRPSVVLALDLGTTAIKVGVLNGDMLQHIVTLEAPRLTMSDGQVEGDALAYAEMAEKALAICREAVSEYDRIAIGISSQRSSFLIWDSVSGRPITPLISWQDSRGAGSCEKLRQHESVIRKKTGLRLTPYYLAPKLRELLIQEPRFREGLLAGKLLVGALDTYLIWRLSGGAHHITDVSMAARTQLMDIHTMRWSSELCELFDIPLTILPRIVPSRGINLRLQKGLVLQASVGDQSAAFYASAGTDAGTALVNLGTGGFVMRLMEVGQDAPEGYLKTLIYQDEKGKPHFAAEGTLNSIAAGLDPYPVNKCLIEELGSSDVYCLAEPSGIGAPYFRKNIGVYFSSTIEQLTPREVATLMLEGVIFRVARILEDFNRISPVKRVYLSGGLSEIACLQHGIAQCAPCEVYRLEQKESSLQGAGILAAGVEMQIRSGNLVRRGDARILRAKYENWKYWLNGMLNKDALMNLH